MANEFYNLEIQCVAPNLVPAGPGVAPENQGCTIQGSTPGSAVVQGADYIQVAFQYSRSHLWRNVGFICAFFVFFLALTAVGMEIQKPNKGGGAVTIYKRGQAPKSVEAAMQTGEEADDIEKNKPDSKDAALSDSDRPDDKLETEKSTSDSDAAETVAKNETVFTWQNVNYTIPYQGNERKLLQDVQGYVRPGKLTALMGASGAGKHAISPNAPDCANCSRKNHSTQHASPKNHIRSCRRRLSRRWKASSTFVPALRRLC